MKKKIFEHISNHINLIKNNFDYFSDEIQKISNEVKKTIKRNGTIFLAGNGGSAADCEHIAGELVGRYKKKGNHLRLFLSQLIPPLLRV
jgi:D-sedoheptulose 7-phosphate isomerase